MEIATVDGFEEIVSIKKIGRIKTYDLQIEGTHNFVGNDIVAHNTFITGNVGIGGTSAGYNLDVWGTGRFTSALTVGGNIGIGASINVSSASVLDSLSVTKSISAATIGTTGNVGIGGSVNTVSAGIFGSLGTSSLSVSGASTLGTLTTIGNVGIGASVNTVSAGIFGSLGTSTLSVSGNTTLSTLTTSGNVGIGASANLVSALISGSVGTSTLSVSGNSTLGTLTTVGNVGIGASANLVSALISGSVGTSTLSVSGNSTLGTLTTVGNVGIGASVNVTSAGIFGSLGTSALSVSGNTTLGTLTTVGNVGIGGSVNTVSAGIFGSLGTSALSVSGNSTLGTLTTVGNVGIGASANLVSALISGSVGTSTLSVSGASTLGTLTTSGNTGIGGSASITGLTYSLGGLRVNGYSDLTGNVGIGGTASFNSLVYSQGSFLAPNGSATAPAYSFTNLTNAGLWTNGDGLLLTTGGSNTSGITVTGTGNVGIGTTVPDSQLQVHSASTNYSTIHLSGGGVTTSGWSIQSDVAGGNDKPALYFIDNSNSITPVTFMASKPSNGAGLVSSVSIAPNYSLLNTAGDGYTALKINATDAAAGALGFKFLQDWQIANVSKMVLTSTGNLGIGTSSPSFQLQATGNVGIGSSLTVSSASVLDSLSVTKSISTATIGTTGNVGIGASVNTISAGIFGSLGTSSLSVSGASTLGTLTTAGNVGIGASVNTVSAGIFGSLGTSALSVSGNTTLSTLTTSGNTGIGGTASITGLTYALGGLRVNGYSDLTGNVGIGTSLSVSSVSILDSLSVTKSISGATLGISGNVGIGASVNTISAGIFGSLGTSTLSVSGNTTLGTLTTSGNTGIGGSASITGLTYSLGGLRVNGYSDLTGNVGIGTSLTVGSGVNLLSSLSVSGNTSLSTLSATGTTTLGGALTFAGVAQDITTGLNEHLTIIPNGTGNVGIGTSSPFARVQVLGAGTGTGLNLLTTSSVGTQGLAVLDNGNVGIGTTNPTTAFQVNVTGVSSFVVNSSGNVGIGTTGFGQKLTFGGRNDMIGWEYASGGDTNTYQSIGRSSTNIYEISYIARAADAGTNIIHNFYGGNTVSKMVIQESGNVGIGTSTPNSKLSVAGGAHIGSVRQGIAAPTDGLFVDGNVGIGATTSSNKLDVWGNTRLAGTLAIDGATTLSSTLSVAGITTLSAGNGALSFTGTTPSLTSGSSVFGLFAGGNVGIGTTGNLYGGLTVRGAGTGTNIALQTYGSGLGQGLTVLDNGNVGIGTTAPTTKLQLSAGSYIGWGWAASDVTVYQSIGRDTSGNQLKYINNGASYATDVAHQFLTNKDDVTNTPVLSILQGGNVGIGTASPQAKLVIQGNVGIGYTGVNQVIPSNGLAVSGNVGIGITTANSTLSVAGSAHIGSVRQGISAPTDGLFVDGNVGIGATTSSNKLDVWGNARIAGTLTLDSNLTLSGGQFLANNGTASLPSYSFSGSTSTGLYSPSANALALNTNGASTPPLTITAGGFVGIGTTAPLAALDVNGTIENGLVGWWSMDEGSGTTLADQSINSNTATLGVGTSAPTWVTGKFSNALSFDGTTDYVDAGNGSSIQMVGKSFSWEAWFKPSVVDEWLGILNKGSSGDDNTIMLMVRSNGKPFFSFYADDLTGTTDLVANTWYHIVGTFDLATLTQTLYLNGVSEGSRVASGAPAANVDTKNFWIGKDYSGNDLFKGVIDEVKVYNRVLSKREVQEHYRQKAPSLAQGGTVSGNFNVLGGNVGIGLTTANSQLSISNNVHIGSLFQGITAPTNGLLVDGNVGIGGTSAGYNLDVWGTGRITSVLTVGGNVGIGGTASVGSAFQLSSFNCSGQTNGGKLTTDSSGNVICSGDTSTAGSITGNGVNNMVARWTAAANVDVGLLYDDGASVGVGTSAPLSRLDIRGAGNGTNLALLTRGTGSANQFGLAVLDNGNVGIGTTAAGSTLAVNGNSVIGWGTASVAGPVNGLGISGNVGIGTTSPGAKLDIINASTTLIGLKVSSSAPNNSEIPNLLIEDTNKDNGYNYWISGKDANGNIRMTLGNEGNYHQRLWASGNLYLDSGVGRIELTDDTFLVGTTPTLTIGDAGAENTSLVFDGNAQDYYMGLDNTDSSLKIGLGSAVGTTPYITILSGGNVGIGVTSPTTFPLQIAGSVGPNADITYDLGSSSYRWKSLHLGPSSLVVHNDNTDTNKATLGFAGSAAQLSSDASTPIQLVSGTNNLGMYLNTSGNVGIGTTSPAVKLDISGDIQTSGSVKMASLNSTFQAATTDTTTKLGSNRFNYKTPVTITNSSGSTLSTSTTYTLILTGSDASTIYNASQTDADDVRIGYNSSEINRIVDIFTSSSIYIRFAIQADIAASGNNANYAVYYGNSSVSAPTDYSGSTLLDNANDSTAWTSSDTSALTVANDTTNFTQSTGSIQTSIHTSDIGAFATTSQGQLPAITGDHGSVTATIGGTGYIYVMGGWITARTNAVYKSTIDTSGNAGAFATANQGQLPASIDQLSAVTATVGGTSYVYVIGGDTSTAVVSTVYRSTIDTSGDLGAFATTSQAQLPATRNQFSAITATIGGTDYIYVIGGYSGTAVVSTVYKSQIDTSGNVGAFATTSQAQLPATRYRTTATTATVGGTSYVYVIGGGDSVSTVYKAQIDTSGNIGTFATTSQGQLPVALKELSSVTTTLGGTSYVYVIGGEGASVVSTVYKAQIDTSGNIGTFATTSQGQLPAVNNNSSAIIASTGGTNYIYEIGGINASVYVSTVYKAQVGNTTSGVTITKTISSTDLSNKNMLTFWLRGATADASNLVIEISEDGTTWQTSSALSLASASTWEQQYWDISGIANSAKDAITKVRLRLTGNITSAFNFDLIRAETNLFSGSTSSSLGSTSSFTNNLYLNSEGLGALGVNYNSSSTGGFTIYDGTTNPKVTVTSGGNVGIGFTSPASTLDVIGTSLLRGSAGTYGLAVTAGGNVGIGTTAPTAQLQLSGATAIKSSGTTWSNPSDIRLKDIVGDYDYGLSEILQINPVRFTFKTDNALGIQDPGEHIGIIAQEIQQIIPEAVSEGSQGYLQFNMDPVIWASVNAIQAQQKEIDDLIVKQASASAILAGLSVDSDGALNVPKLKSGSIILDPSLASASAQLSSAGSQLSIPGGIEGLGTDSSPGPNLASNTNQYIDLSGEIASLGKRIAVLETAKNEATESASLAQVEATDSASIIQATTLDLTPPDILLATGSATLANLKVTSEATVSGMLTAYDLNIQNGLKALGKTTLGETLIAGNLTIDGTMSITGNSVNAISTLYLQNNPLSSSLDIFNSKVTIDKDGNIAAQGEIAGASIVTNKLTISNTPIATSSATLAASIGTATLPANTTSATIQTTGITDSSKVFITPVTTTDKVLSVTNIQPGVSFDVSVLSPATSDIKFNWWIIQTQ